MKRLIQIALLIVIMTLLNIVGHITGLFFIEEYNKNAQPYHFWESLFLIILYSVFQVIAFSNIKKLGIFIIPIFTLILFAFILFFCDPSGFGGEVVHTVVTLGSKIIYISYFLIAYSVGNETSRIIFVDLLHSFGYSLYLLSVFFLHKFVLKLLCERYSFSG